MHQISVASAHIPVGTRVTAEKPEPRRTFSGSRITNPTRKGVRSENNSIWVILMPGFELPFTRSPSAAGLWCQVTLANGLSTRSHLMAVHRKVHSHCWEQKPGLAWFSVLGVELTNGRGPHSGILQQMACCDARRMNPSPVSKS